MKAIPIHTVELMKIRLTYEQLRNAAIDRITTLYKMIRKSAETEDLVLFMWIVLVIALVYTGYSRFAECGKIIGLYKELRF
jgi:hypothetical protein